MGFPPPKPGVKQWAGGAKPNPAPPAPAPPLPPAPAPGAPAAPGALNPQMIARAYTALGTIIMGGGLPQPVTDLLMQANQMLVEAKGGAGAAPPAPAPAPHAAPPPPAAPPGGPPKKPGFPPK